MPALDPVLRRLLYEPEVDCTWKSPDGTAEVSYHRGGDYFTWTINGKDGQSDLTEHVLAALGIIN